MAIILFKIKTKINYKLIQKTELANTFFIANNKLKHQHILSELHPYINIYVQDI